MRVMTLPGAPRDDVEVVGGVHERRAELLLYLPTLHQCTSDVFYVLTFQIDSKQSSLVHNELGRR